jgi:CIC family chloride channel protein
LLDRFFPNARGSVPQTKAALFASGGRITLRTVLGKFFCTSATPASRIPLGREGPSVQVGAGIGSVLGRLVGLSAEQVKNLIPVGAAAAIAAAVKIRSRFFLRQIVRMFISWTASSRCATLWTHTA